MPLDFPSSPALNQIFLGPNGIAYQWDGVKWAALNNNTNTNVKDFGAIGNGVHDDTTAIQAAASAVPSTGGVLLFPAGGNFLISSPITLKSNTAVWGAGATITAAPGTVWSTTISAFVGTSISNISVNRLNFVWPQGHVNYGSNPAAHILAFISCTNVKVLECTSVGGTDLVANVGCTDVLMFGNRAVNVSNSAYDSWGGATDIKVIGNWCSTLASETNPGIGAIQFTGFNTDGSPATSTGFVCIGNRVFCSNANAQCVIINGPTSGGVCSKIVVADNVMTVGGTNTWGVLCTGLVTDADIHDNYLEGANGAFCAVGVFTPATNVRVERNTAQGWVAGAAGVFANTAVGGTLLDNEGYSCSTPLFTSVDTTTKISGNDTGTGLVESWNVDIHSGQATFTLGLTSINPMTIGWNGAGGPVSQINSAAGHTAGWEWLTAGVGHWYLGTDATTQSGGNVGDNFQLQCFSDTGTFISTPIFINRANGAIGLSALQNAPSYANDAAAAAGGVGPGFLYRNGSVVQIRVA